MENTYRTKDLWEASLLYFFQKKLIDLEKDSSFFWFIFDDRPGCQDLINKYWNHETMVDAKGFVDAIQSLKSRIFGLKKRMP